MLKNLFLKIVTLLLTILLWLLQWKKATIKTNTLIVGIKWTTFSLWRFYFTTVQHFLRFLLSSNFKIKICSRDYLKLMLLKQTGGVLLTAHYNNWELLGSWLRKNGLELKGAATPFKLSWAEKVLMRVRQKNNLPTITHNVSREALRWVLSHKVFGFLLDQHIDKGQIGCFCNKQVSFNSLPNFLLQKTKKPCYAVFLVQNRVRVFVLKNHDKESLFWVGSYYRILRAVILKKPYDWIGFCHRFFKKENVYHVSHETI